MPANYMPTATNHATITVPVDGDAPNAASVSTGMEQLADNVANVEATYLPLSGGTMTGAVTLSSAPLIDAAPDAIAGLFSGIQAASGHKKAIATWYTGPAVSGHDPGASVYASGAGTDGQLEIAHNCSWNDTAQTWGYHDSSNPMATRLIVSSSSGVIVETYSGSTGWADSAWVKVATFGGAGAQIKGTTSGSEAAALFVTSGAADAVDATSNGAGAAVSASATNTGDAVDATATGSGNAVSADASAGSGCAMQAVGNATRSPLRLVPQAQPSAPQNGEEYVDSSTNSLMAYINGAWVAVYAPRPAEASLSIAVGSLAGGLDYWKDSNGVVHLDGSFGGTSSGGGSQTLCTLPAGFRPVRDQYMQLTNNAHAGGAFPDLYVQIAAATGVITFVDSSGVVYAANSLYFSGMSFRA